MRLKKTSQGHAGRESEGRGHGGKRRSVLWKKGGVMTNPEREYRTDSARGEVP